MTVNTERIVDIWKEWQWVLLPIFYFIFLTLLFPFWTAEDAYIMLRYARNAANGYWFIYNPGDPPIWGSTSFLMTVSLAVLIWLGLPPLNASFALGYLQGIILIVSVYAIERRVLSLSIFSSIISCMVLASGQIVALALMGFDAILFGLLMVLSFGFSLWIFHHSSSNEVRPELVWGLGIVSVLLSLTRPEGALVSIATFLVIFWQKRDIGRSRLFLLTCFAYILCLVVFYTWTTLYFGNPLPNPFYIKTGSMIIYPSSFITLGGFLLFNWLIVLWIVVWIIRAKWGTTRYFVFASLPAMLYALAYLAINQIQNIQLRFQFPLAPILLILFAQAFDHFFPNLPESLSSPSPNLFKLQTKVIALLVIIGVFTTPLAYHTVFSPWGEMPDALQVGVVLNKYKDQGYTMIVTEAGRLPFYADWYTVDGYGLNDPIIAHHGLTEDYIASHNPELIMFWNRKYFEYNSEWAASTDPWDVMCEELYLYATNNNYTVACIFRAYIRWGPNVYHEGYQWYFVRPDFVESSVIINDLQTIEVLDYVYPHP